MLIYMESASIVLVCCCHVWNWSLPHIFTWAYKVCIWVEWFLFNHFKSKSSYNLRRLLLYTFMEWAPCSEIKHSKIPHATFHNLFFVFLFFFHLEISVLSLWRNSTFPFIDKKLFYIFDFQVSIQQYLNLSILLFFLFCFFPHRGIQSLSSSRTRGRMWKLRSRRYSSAANRWWDWQVQNTICSYPPLCQDYLLSSEYIKASQCYVQ